MSGGTKGILIAKPKGKEADPMDKKTVYGMLAAAGGLAVLGIGAWAAWNSRQARISRATRYAGRLMYRVGGAMQSLSAAIS